MSLDSVVTQGRAAAEALMFDACTITRSGGATTFDPSTGAYTDPDATSVYAGKCRVQVPNLVEQTAVAGEAVVSTQVAVVSVPLSVSDVAVDDVVTITAAEYDDDLVGVTYRVTAIHRKSQATARRMRCEEVT